MLNVLIKVDQGFCDHFSLRVMGTVLTDAPDARPDFVRDDAE